MVFPGRFSTGCIRCRQRKVKCDEERPSCRRCQTYGRPCLGYTDQFHFRFDKNVSKQRKASSSQHHREESRAAIQNCQSSLQVTRNARPPAILRQPEILYDEISLCYFIRRFVAPDENDNFPGHLSSLPSLYNHGSRGLLELATLSVAQLAAYNQFGGTKFRLQSYQNYGRALRALRETIDAQNQVTDDRVIAAVLLLSMFKDIGEDWCDPTEHASGIYYLLEKRGVEQFATARGVELFHLGLLKLQIYSFLHQDDRYNDPGGLVEWLSQFDPMVRAMFLMIRIMRLRHSLLRGDADLHKSVKPGTESSQWQRRSYEQDEAKLQACFETFGDLDAWDMEAQPYWKNTFGSRSVPAAFGTLAQRETYCDPRTACLIIFVRCSRLVLLLSILEYYDKIQASCSESGIWRVGNPMAWAECIPMLKQDVHLAIDETLYCVPFAMGDRGPDGTPISSFQDGAATLLINQQVRLITYCAYATPEQRRSARNILTRMKSAVGVKSATPWEDLADPQQPGTEGLVRAMASLMNTETPVPPPPSH
ncbi:hypothetical protein F4861DRAFT_549510 [Xylaria intraflava]|nr:hypothetical protein F4861DRAFT_549510 [Xylaria intraflava]